ncbi:hypothetical protein GFM02_01765 [Rhizobium leguminosarum bv. viciae]|nr:hypothetical protein [Rhizobium leguminosarum bv. viciae]NKL79564.1 hypothetical protein [Rhizobium leguminosarum bv. viciae]NKM03269.1 hypothetical protein [Rhizobium leguminosarum bv. viciae]
MDSLLFFLGDILSEWLTGNSSKSVFMRWVERIVISFVIVLIALGLFYMYRTRRPALTLGAAAVSHRWIRNGPE